MRALENLMQELTDLGVTKGSATPGTDVATMQALKLVVEIERRLNAAESVISSTRSLVVRLKQVLGGEDVDTMVPEMNLQKAVPPAPVPPRPSAPTHDQPVTFQVTSQSLLPPDQLPPPSVVPPANMPRLPAPLAPHSGVPLASGNEARAAAIAMAAAHNPGPPVPFHPGPQPSRPSRIAGYLGPGIDPSKLPK